MSDSASSGFKFFPQREWALEEIHRVLARHGRLALNVFGPIEHNPATHALATALERHARPGASVAKRTEHALGDVGQLRALCTGAGFHEVQITTRTKQVRFPSAADYVRIQFSATPLATVIGELPLAAREELITAVIADVAGALARYQTDEGLAFPQEVHRVLATA